MTPQEIAELVAVVCGQVGGLVLLLRGNHKAKKSADEVKRSSAELRTMMKSLRAYVRQVVKQHHRAPPHLVVAAAARRRPRAVRKSTR